MSDRTFDVRIIERNIKHGSLSRDEVNAYLERLPDVAHKATHMPPLELAQQSEAEGEPGAAPSDEPTNHAEPAPAPAPTDDYRY